LLEPAQFAGKFATSNANELHAALALLNDRFDDVPEQLNAKLAKAPEPWRHALASMTATLAARRDERMRLTQRLDYPHRLDMQGYDRTP
jgi:hypothetical protein